MIAMVAVSALGIMHLIILAANIFIVNIVYPLTPLL